MSIRALLRCVLFVAAIALTGAPARALEPDRVERLLAQMTLEEKIAQLNQRGGGEPRDADPAVRERRLNELLALARSGKVGSWLGACGAEHTRRLQEATLEGSRLKIPALMAQDVIHGYRTIFPTPLAESCSWDPALAERTAAAAAKEARAAGVDWTFAPMVDIARDPRWGRIVEGAGEDPRLGAAFAAARVRGFQGDNPAAPDRVLACAKHFAAYGAAEGGRDYNTADLSTATLEQVYLPPFKAAVDAGVASFMTAFNEINGVPCSGSVPLLRGVLRSRWGFGGVVISDFASIKEMAPHGFAADERDAARLGMIAGVDIDMMSDGYADHLAGLVTSGAVPIAVVDEAVRRVLRLKERAGLFDRALPDPAHEARVLLSPEMRTLAREAAARSMVLLKNEAGVLPLKDGLKRIAVVGPLADSGRDLLGTWACTGRGEETITPLAGLRELGAARGFEVAFASGGAALQDDPAARAAAVEAARGSDLVIAVVGEPESITGEGNSRSLVELPAPQQRLLEDLKATGKPLVVVLVIGRPLALTWVAQNADAVLVAWHAGTEGGSALADVLSGAVNPSGRLTTSFPRNVGQIPIYYNHKPTGRPHKPGERFVTRYNDVEQSPLYPFGFGLSYTTFDLRGARVSQSRLSANDAVILNVEVANTGPRAGAEVVQWYLRDPHASQTRPVKELVAFARVDVAPGMARAVSLSIPARELGFIDDSGAWRLEPGTVYLHAAGGNVRTQEIAITIE